MTEIPSDFPSRIKRLRGTLGLTQMRLAELMGVSFATINRWENGHVRPSPLAWRQIAQAELDGVDAFNMGASRAAEPPPPPYGEAVPPTLDFSAEPEVVRAVAEAERLTYGHLFNPAFAAEVSLIEPLPHQRIAVYDHLLKLPRIRFLLADDPGAGKTIMSGLLIRELLCRRLVRRVLIVPPAGLVPNWKREMRSLFHLPFEIVAGRDAKAGNPFTGESSDLVIVSVDTLSGDRMFARLGEPEVVPYDIVFFDEAHKLSANRNADYTIDKTDRYRLAEAIAGIFSEDPRWMLPWSSHHLMLLTATPHMGREYPYYALWRLLEPEVFSSIDAFNAFPRDSRRRYFIRRMKEEMVRYDNTRIYPMRVSDTLGCPMSAEEFDLYTQTTDYIRTTYNRARILNRSAARLAMSVFQRRLTSSTYAMLRSFERRIDRLDELIDAIRSGKIDEKELEARQRKLGDSLPDPIDTKTADEEEGEDTGAVEDQALGGVVAVSLAELEAERLEVERLKNLAQHVYDLGQESKFDRLLEVIRNPRFKDEKLLIFTEHKDTLEFLVKRLEGVGYAGRVAQIHGGMAYGEDADVNRLTERQDHVEFFRLPGDRGGATYMVCTDAAAEGINLQFCWLMLNYDVPWNPARLEQRMGRVHRFGQKHDPVHVINLVADPEKTREGRVLKTLLDKLEKIRKDLGDDKVFDVIGLLFEGMTLGEYMEAVVVSGSAAATVAKLEGKITKEQVEVLRERERKLFGSGGDVRDQLPKLKAELEFEELRRLMPGYVRRFVEKAAPLLGIGIDGDLDAIFSLKPSRPFALEPLLPLIEAYPVESRNRFSIRRPKDPTTAIFLHPGESVFDKLSAWISSRFDRDAHTGAVFIDPYAPTPYLFHLALLAVLRRSDAAFAGLAREETLECRLVGVRQDPDGHVATCPMEHLLLLRGGQGVPTAARKLAASAQELLATVEIYLSEAVVSVAVSQHRERLTASIPERENYLRQGYDYQEADLAATRSRLTEKARAGSTAAKTELERIKTRQRQLQQRRDDALAVLMREPELLEADAISFIAHALVVPSSDPADRKRHDSEVERIAMLVAWAYEEAAPAKVMDVHTPELALAVGLNDYPGFDLLSRRPGGEERDIEVKGRAGVGEVEISENEWARAATLRERYWLYVVYDCASERPRLFTIQDPFKALLSHGRGVVIQAEDILASGPAASNE